MSLQLDEQWRKRNAHQTTNFAHEAPLVRLLPNAAHSPLVLSICAINSVSALRKPCRMHVLVWKTHLLRDHVRRQARRLALSNNLTPKSTRAHLKRNPDSVPLNAVEI
jgi:hypothetical protein